MFTINFNPTILKIGFLQIRWYGMAYVLGFVLLYLWLRNAAKKGWVEGLNKDKAEELLLYIMLGVIIGSRLFEFIFYDPTTLIKDPLEIFRLWHGGMSFHGGLIGVVAAVLLFVKKNKIKIWPLLDLTSVVAIFSLMVGRIANFINGELAGTPFNGPWCAVFVNYDSVCRHPYPIYAFISHFILLSVLLLLIYLRRKDIKNFIGSKILSLTFLFGYGALRIITDIFKEDNVIFGIKTGQWLSIFMIIAAAIIVITDRLKRKKD